MNKSVIVNTDKVDAYVKFLLNKARSRNKNISLTVGEAMLLQKVMRDKKLAKKRKKTSKHPSVPVL